MKTFTLLFLILLLGQAKMNAQVSRVIAASTYYYNGADFYAFDSTWYSYTGNNGGQAGGTIDYTTATSYGYDTSIDLYSPVTLTQQSFDANHNITGVITQTWDDTTQSWLNYSKVLSYFDANNNDTLTVYYSFNLSDSLWYITTAIHIAVSGNAITYVYQSYDTALQTYINTQQVLDTNAQNGVQLSIFDEDWNNTAQTWYPTSWSKWNLNADGNDSFYLYITYDTSAGTWTNFEEAWWTYNADSTINTETVAGWNSISSVWDSAYRDAYSYDANKNDTLYVIQSYNAGWLNLKEQENQFNSYNQLTYSLYYNWNGAAYVPSEEQHYYYQLYSGINNLSDADNSLQLYPNPASDMVYVSATLAQEQPVQVMLYNNLGQQLWIQDMGIAKSIKATVPLRNLAPGAYTVTVKQGSTLQTRQVVVE